MAKRTKEEPLWSSKRLLEYADKLRKSGVVIQLGTTDIGLGPVIESTTGAQVAETMEWAAKRIDQLESRLRWTFIRSKMKAKGQGGQP